MKVGPGAEGFDLSPDEKQIWAANAGDGTISVVDVAQKTVTETFNIASKRSNRLKFTPDGKLALVSDLTSGEIVVVDVASRKAIKRLPVGKGVAGVLIAPDGSRAYAAATNDNWVTVIDVKSLTVIGKIETGIGPDGDGLDPRAPLKVRYHPKRYGSQQHARRIARRTFARGRSDSGSGALGFVARKTPRPPAQLDGCDEYRRAEASWPPAGQQEQAEARRSIDGT